jgi:hypothetical protein
MTQPPQQPSSSGKPGKQQGPFTVRPGNVPAKKVRPPVADTSSEEFSVELVPLDEQALAALKATASGNTDDVVVAELADVPVADLDEVPVADLADVPVADLDEKAQRVKNQKPPAKKPPPPPTAVDWLNDLEPSPPRAQRAKPEGTPLDWLADIAQVEGAQPPPTPDCSK